ncbi:hypothetical protein F5884DRAFT_745964 [Xylogone sp. PMI_703]|nr:hypothetical protein F5884DRAFT_745964 [Xylogone sp. PMI_703]
MAPTGKDSGAHGRRKSLSIFSKGALPSITHTNVDSEKFAESEQKDKKKTHRRGSIFGLGSSASLDLTPDIITRPATSENAESFKLRGRGGHKAKSSSIFGSMSRRSMLSIDDDDDRFMAVSGSPSEDCAVLSPAISLTKAVLHHGEVQTTSSMFRKKKEYLVLTDTHLIRFKSISKASEVFPSIPPTHGRASTTRHPSTASIGSLQDIQSNHSHSSGDGETRIPLEQIVSVYKIEDGRHFSTTEIVYLDEEYAGVGSIQLMMPDPKQADTWRTAICDATEQAKLLMAQPYPKRIVQYLIDIVSSANDYSPDHFQVFRVVRRAAIPRSGKSSAEDLQKLGASVFYMVIGINRIYMIPLPDYTSKFLVSKASRNIFGIVTLVAINVQHSDDRFELGFRMPLHPLTLLELAASGTRDIAVALFRALQFLRPTWLEHYIHYHGPSRLPDIAESSPYPADEEYGCFDRTLSAFCIAYNCDPTNIRYAVDWNVEDAPEFALFPPANTPQYTIFELLSVMRALRYNESFRSISFKDIDLHGLHGLHDTCGSELVDLANRGGIPISLVPALKPQERSLLYQEVQSLVLKSRQLRRLNFANCLPRRRPRDTFDEEGGAYEKDPGCEIVAAIMPVCRTGLTEVTWVILNGIELGETDFDDLLLSLGTPTSRFRAIECSHSGLNDRLIMQLLSHLERQSQTLEVINIADNPGRLQLDRFEVSMSRFTHIRKLDLSRITRTSGDEPLLSTEVMLTWRLEELIMNGITVNDMTLDAIAAYLTSDMSENLSVLQMDQCNLTGSHVALLMRAMTRTPGQARELQLHVSANRLEKGIDEIVTAMRENYGPTRLIIQMIEFTKEEYFKQLLEALRSNTIIRSLDISKASLPYDASPDTCDTLRLLFAENSTLEELDISGEHAHLEVTRFGIGLNHALTGLKDNTSLKVLRIEYQNLGLEGANTLASVLAENKGLTHIYCEHNDINLQGFTILVNAIAQNHTILHLPFMRHDQDESIKRIGDSMRDYRRNGSKESNIKSIQRRFTQLSIKSGKEKDPTPQDLDEVIRVLLGKWEEQGERLAVLLDRNMKIANGAEEYTIGGPGILDDDILRPTTALSDWGIFEHVMNNTTPKVELGNPVDEHSDGTIDLPPEDPDTSPDEILASQESPLLHKLDVGLPPILFGNPDSLLPEVPVSTGSLFEMEELSVFNMDK